MGTVLVEDGKIVGRGETREYNREISSCMRTRFPSQAERQSEVWIFKHILRRPSYEFISEPFLEPEELKIWHSKLLLSGIYQFHI